jgi:hypothetical protein
LLRIDRAELDSLYGWLSERLDTAGRDHTMRFTELWAVVRQTDWTRLKEAFGTAGGYCDCEVLANTDPDKHCRKSAGSPPPLTVKGS